MTTEAAILQTQTIADSAPGWSVPLSFGAFDPSIGTLSSIDVGIVGDVTGTAAIQNLGATATSLQIDLPGTIDVAAPDGTVLASVSPEASTTVKLGAYDGTAGFTGSSGTVVSGFSSVATAVSDYIPSPGTGAAFVGTGSIDLTASSQVSSSLYADGNLLSLTQGEAGAAVSVQYNYQPPAGGSYDGSDSTSLAWESGVTTIFELGGPVVFRTTAPQTLTVSDRTTDWNSFVTADQFNSALGALWSVNLTITGDINAGLAVENLGSASASIGLTDTANITLTLPGGLGAVAADPSIHSSTVLAAFDGTVDFAGASGENLTGLTGTESVSSQLSGDLSDFIGTGTIALPIAADSPSILTGPADLAAELLTEAGATVTISYTYIVPSDSVPILSGTPLSTPVVTPPIISGTAAGQGVTDQTTVKPFANVLITDPNAAQTETVTVRQSVAGNGTLSQLGGGSYNVATGVYSVTGSAASVTAALDGLVFTPAAVSPGQTVSTGFSITDTDTNGLSVTDATTSVAATAGVSIDTAAAAAAIVTELDGLASPPTIAGTKSGQAVTDQGTIAPLSGVTIGDGNANQTESVTVTLSAAGNGTLTNLGGGHYNALTGVYTDSGSAAAITAALDGLVFKPVAGQVAPGQTVTTDFTITDTDTAGAKATNTATSVISTATIGIGATGPSGFIHGGSGAGQSFSAGGQGAISEAFSAPWSASGSGATLPGVGFTDFGLNAGNSPGSGFSASFASPQGVYPIMTQFADAGSIAGHLPVS